MVEEPTSLLWDPPGPGTWRCDRDHKRTSQTVALQGFFPRAMEAGFRAGTARYGLPISHLAIRYVNGYAYAQMQMAGVPAKAAGSGPPPRPILFALVRLLPEMRRRAKAAEETLATRRWRADAKQWFEVTPMAAGDAPAVRAELEQRGKGRPTFAIAAGDGQIYYLSLRRDVSLDDVPSLKGPEVLRTLDVTLLHALVIEGILGIDRAAQERQTNLRYVKDTGAALALARDPDRKSVV